MKQKMLLTSLLVGGLVSTATYAEDFTLTVSGPNGYYYQEVVQSKVLPMGNFTSDGLYKYEFSPHQVVVRELSTDTSKIDRNGRVSYIQTSTPTKELEKEFGHFRVLNGTKIQSNDIKEAKDDK